MENIHSEPIEVIGKHFETNPDGKFTLESFKEIAKTMEIYSDKHYETARYLFVKDGQILRHIAVSSQTPASTIIKPDDNFLYQLKSYAKQTESKIVFLHNHPSGYVEPSEADINLTSYMQNFFKESSGEDLFAGHIILDHGTYGLYNAESKDWKALINNELEPLSKLSESLKLQLTKYGMRTKNEDDTISAQSLKQLSDYAKNCDSINMWNTKDWIPSFLMSGNGIVTSLEYINVRELEDYKNLSNKLKTLGRNYGSENIVLLPQHQDQFLSCERFAQLTGKVKDIYFENPDGSYKTSQFRNGNIFNDLTKDEIKVQDTNDNPELVNEKIMFENINKIYKENKIMDNEEKIESDISENVNTAENTVITTKELAEKTISFVTGNTFSKRNQENIASLLDALRIQDKFLGEEVQLISEDQIMMADISIEDFANNMKDIPFAVITVPNEVDEGEEQTFHEEKYYFLDSLPDFFKEKVLDFKSEIQFNQNLRNAKLMPLTEKNIKDFQKIFLDNIEKSKISPEMQRNISNKLTDAIEGTKSENKNVKKDSFKILRTFISAGQIMSSKNSNDGFNAAIHNATSLKDIFEITGNVAYEEYKRGISNIDKFNPELIQQYGELSKLSKILRPEAPFNLNIYDSVINPEGHAYTQIEKETSINNANLSEPEKSVSQKKEKNTVETNFSSQSNAENKTNTEIDSIKEELQKQFKETIDEMKKQYELQYTKLNEMLKQSDERNKELQNQLDMMREQIKETGVTANESQAVSGNKSIPGPVMQEERSNEKKAANFNLDTAYIANTPVPKFGRIETKTDEFGNEIPTGKIEIIKNAIFERIIINDADSSKNEIVLSVPLPDGNHREIKMPEKDYNNIIVAENKLREDLKGMSEDSWAWMKAHVDHDKRLLLDENKYRLNTAEDFIHNYKIHCRKHARNPEEAMKIAAWMVKRMTPFDRERFNKMRDSNRELFDKKLLEEFELASKDKTLDKSDFNFDMSGPNELFAEASPELIELKPGELIPGTRGTKVGTSIPMVLKVKDMFNKKNIEIEKANYKIMKVSKDLYPEDKIILMNEKTKALHCLPLKDVVTHIQKIEKQQIKEETKKIKKDHKIYGYEGRS